MRSRAAGRARTRQQLERLERYGAHLANQNDRIIERLERLERYGAHLSQQNDNAATLLAQLGRADRTDHPTSALGRPIGFFPADLANALRRAVGIRRAVETGTAGGHGTRLMAGIFDEVTSIELSEELHEFAKHELSDLSNVRLLQGDSRSVLGEALVANEPTLYWLDGHWVGPPTGGEDAQCPVLEEIAQLRAGHPGDCILIDDARCFTASPPPPFAAEQWPTLIDVTDALRDIRPANHLTIVHDLIVSVPGGAKPVIDQFNWGALEAEQAPAPNGRTGQASSVSST